MLVSLRSLSIGLCRYSIHNRNTFVRIKISAKFCTTSSSESLRLLDKGRLISSNVEALAALTHGYARTHLDLGTGDGKYVYHQAKEQPDTFFIGVDLHPEKMYHFSWKTGRKPSKGGGINNVIFICSSLEQLPSSLTRIADSISINLPWSGLLMGLVTPNPLMLRSIVHLAKDQADLAITLNYTIFKNYVYAQSLGLPIVNPEYVENKLKPAYKECNIYLKTYQILHSSKNRTTWGQSLVLGGQRELLWLSAKISHE